MPYRIVVEPDFLRAELFGRDTEDQTKSFLGAVLHACIVSGRSRVLIHVSSSRPVFQMESHGLLEYFRKLAESPSSWVALVGDTADLRLSHDYIEFVARQHGLHLRSFRDEAAALEWFGESGQRTDQRHQPDRRQRQGEADRPNRYRGPERRRAQRRAGSEGSLRSS
jgi:hypothetical protein